MQNTGENYYFSIWGEGGMSDSSNLGWGHDIHINFGEGVNQGGQTWGVYTFVLQGSTNFSDPPQCVFGTFSNITNR